MKQAGYIIAIIYPFMFYNKYFSLMTTFQRLVSYIIFYIIFYIYIYI